MKYYLAVVLIILSLALSLRADTITSTCHLTEQTCHPVEAPPNSEAIGEVPLGAGMLIFSTAPPVSTQFGTYTSWVVDYSAGGHFSYMVNSQVAASGTFTSGRGAVDDMGYMVGGVSLSTLYNYFNPAFFAVCADSCATGRLTVSVDSYLDLQSVSIDGLPTAYNPEPGMLLTFSTGILGILIRKRV